MIDRYVVKMSTNKTYVIVPKLFSNEKKILLVGSIVNQTCCQYQFRGRYRVESDFFLRPSKKKKQRPLASI